MNTKSITILPSDTLFQYIENNIDYLPSMFLLNVLIYDIVNSNVTNMDQLKGVDFYYIKSSRDYYSDKSEEINNFIDNLSTIISDLMEPEKEHYESRLIDIGLLYITHSLVIITG